MEFEIKIDNVKIFISREINFNERPTIIFLHESLGCTELWRDFPGLLGEAARCNILVYDRQGYGRSDPFTSEKRKNDYLETEADTLNKLMILCGIKDAVLFGHSDGGTIALIAASKFPGKISGVIAEGSHVFVEEITLNGIRKTVEVYHKTDLKNKLTKYHGDKTDAVIGTWADKWLSDEFRNWNIENFLPGIKCPVLVIQGENDEYGSIKQADTIFCKVNGHSVKFIVPNTGHTPHREAAELTIIKSSEFINNLTANVDNKYFK